MLKEMKKIISSLLIVALILPSVAMADSDGVTEDFKVNYVDLEETDQLKDTVRKEFSDGKMAFEEVEEEEKVETLRVLVELEGKPLIVSAMEQGVKVSELSTDFKVNEENKLLSSQEKVKTLMAKENVEGVFLNNYTNILNGFAMEVDSDLLEEIENLPGVKKVEPVVEYERPEEVRTPRMGSSGGMINANKTWDSGFTGEGMLVAVLDTGADPNHRDFVISDGIEVAMTEADANSLIEKHSLDGKYFNSKVPYGYNYYDKSNIVIHDDGPTQHGMHVSGTVLANGDEANGGIKGIAPEAQLLSMKVFSNDIINSTTFTDIYLKAIDDSIALGADALNMSLGAPAGFYIENSIEQEALARAEESGIINSISSGNSRNIGYGASVIFGRDMDSYEYNPDVGVVGSPSVNMAALTVAAAENSKMMKNYMKANPPIEGVGNMVLQEAADIVFSSLDNTDGYEYVYSGIGKEEDFEKVKDEVKGKIALVQRGNNFAETIVNAQEVGAIGCIVFNHEAGGDDLINMAGGDLATIPFAFTTYKAGRALRENIEDTKLVFPKGMSPENNPIGGSMSEFSSWGALPDLRLKPEITGPGGNIYSTQNNDTYGVMSGTSMSSPHSAGGSVLIKDYISKNKEVFGNQSEKEISLLTRNMMMNTANIINQLGRNIPYSPRVQGAGMMDLSKATMNKVIVVDKDNNTSKGRAKVELGEVNNTLNFNLDIKNYGDKDLEYDVSAIVLEQVIEGDKLKDSFKLAKEVNNVKKIKLKGKESKAFKFSIDISNLKDGQFADGFIKLEEKTGKGLPLVVPFLGFKGDWGKPKVIDTIDPSNMIGQYIPELTDLNRDTLSQYRVSAFVEEKIDGGYYTTPNRILYRTEEDEVYRSKIVPYITQLRSAKEIKYSILDKNEEEIRVIGVEKYPRKAHSMNRGIIPRRRAGAGAWDGILENQLAKDGKYVYRIESKLQYDTESQKDDYDLIVDSTGPIIHEGAMYDNESNRLTFEAQDTIKDGLLVDEVSGLGAIVVESRDKDLEIIDLDQASEYLEYELLDKSKNLYKITLDLSSWLEDSKDSVRVFAIDRLSNISDRALDLNINKSEAKFVIGEPSLLIVEGGTEEEIAKGSKEIDVSGYICGWANGDLESLTANGKELKFVYKDDVTIKNGEDLIYEGPAYYFEDSIELEDGYHSVEFKANSKADMNGRVDNLSIARYVLVDLVKPVFNIEKNIVDEILSVDIEAEDNQDFLGLYRNGSFLTDTSDSNLSFGEPSSIIYQDEFKLKRGLNEIKYTLQDRAYEVEETLFIFNEVGYDEDIDVSKLLGLIRELDSKDLSIYTEESVGEVNKNLEEAKEGLREKELNQEYIDSLLENLEEALDNLESKVVDKTRLAELINNAREKNKSNYTVETFSRLKKSIEKAVLVYEDEDASQEEVSRAVEAIEEAIKGLVKVDKETEGPEPEDPGTPIYPTLPPVEEKPEEPKPEEPESPEKEEKTAVEKKLEFEDYKGYVNGYKDGSFRAENEISREEVATIINNLLNDEYREDLKIKEIDFKDVKEGRWSEDAIKTIYSMELIEGYKDGSFRPEANITRAEFATILNRLGELELGEIKVELDDIKGHWGEEDIINVMSNGWGDKIEKDKFRPDDNLLRYEMVVMINKVLELDSEDLEEAERLEFEDLTGKEWYYDEIMKAVIFE